MACGTNAKRIVSIAHAAVTMAEPVGGSVSEDIQWGENYPGTRISGCIWIERYIARASAKWQGLVTPGVRGTTGNLVFTVKKIDDSGNTTITCADFKAGAAGFDLNTAPYPQTQDFRFDPQSTENLAPITVA